jgi:hypothetical protein
MRPVCARHKHRGVIIMDVLVALGIAAVLLTSFSIAAGAFQRDERRLAATRANYRHLEASLFALQSGGQVDSDIRIEKLDNGPTGRVWVRVSAIRWEDGIDRRNQNIVGLAPAAAAERGAVR